MVDAPQALKSRKLTHSEWSNAIERSGRGQAVDTLRIHERCGRAKPIKVERRDGTIDEVDVETVVEGVTRKHQVEALAENLPECACCGRKVAPVDQRSRGSRARVVLCSDCPSCACGARLHMKTMAPSNVSKRAGARPYCGKCPPPRTCKVCGSLFPVKGGMRRKEMCDNCMRPKCDCGATHWPPQCRDCHLQLKSLCMAPSNIAKRGELLPRCQQCAALAVPREQRQAVGRAGAEIAKSRIAAMSEAEVVAMQARRSAAISSALRGKTVPAELRARISKTLKGRWRSMTAEERADHVNRVQKLGWEARKSHSSKGNGS